MSDYSKTTNFGVKDGLTTGDSNKLVKGSELDTEFDAIETASATKADSASPTFTGTVTAASLTMTGTYKLGDTSSDHYYTFAVSELIADRTCTFPLLTGNDTFVFEAHTATLTNKTIDLGTNTLTGSKTEFNTAAQSDTFLFSSDLLDEDDLSSDSSTAPASQQSIKAYVDAQIVAPGYVDTSGTPVLNDFAKFTDADTVEGRSYTEVKSDLGLVIGTDVQAQGAVLDDLNTLGANAADSEFLVGTGAGALAWESGNTVRTSLGLAIGTDVQAYDANLPTWPSTVDATEVGYLNGVTSAIQTQMDTKAPIADPTFTGEIGIGAVNVSETELGILEGATLTTTELNYVDGVTSAIQTQIDNVGRLVLLVSTTASSVDTVEFDSTYITTTYDEYIVTFHEVIPATDSVSFGMRTSDDNGSTFEAGASDYVTQGDGQSAQIELSGEAGVGSAAGENGVSGYIVIINPTDVASQTGVFGDITIVSDSGTVAKPGYGANQALAAQRLVAEDNDAIQFLFASGQIESGTISLYGVKNA